MRTTVMVLGWLAIAATAYGQVPDYGAAVRACADRYPADFACAHTERPCKADFEIKCARDIVEATGDRRVGLNWKRGVVGDLSLDILGYRGIGPSRDVVAQAPMAVIDIIACAGGDPPRCGPSPIWRVYTAEESPIGAWVDPFSVQPSSGGGGPPPPSKLWTAAHTALYQQLIIRGFATTRAIAEQFAFSFPAEGWGQKAAEPSRPVSQDVIARTVQGQLVGYRVLPALETAEIALAGQHFVTVAPENHLGAAPPPDPDPPPPPTTGDLAPVLEAIRELRTAMLKAFEELTIDFIKHLVPVLDALVTKVQGLEATVNGFGDSVLPILHRVEEHLAAKPTTTEWPEYVGTVLGRTVVLRPRN